MYLYFCSSIRIGTTVTLLLGEVKLALTLCSGCSEYVCDLKYVLDHNSDVISGASGASAHRSWFTVRENISSAPCHNPKVDASAPRASSLPALPCSDLTHHSHTPSTKHIKQNDSPRFRHLSHHCACGDATNKNNNKIVFNNPCFPVHSTTRSLSSSRQRRRFLSPVAAVTS